MTTENQVLDLDGITTSLDELVKAADATDIVAKSYGGTNVETSGRYDEDGKGGGGMAESGDMGGLDDMMIGKMAAALIDQGFSADSIQAFMSAKASDEDEEDDDDMHGEMGMVHGKRPSPTGKMERSAEPTAGAEPLSKAIDDFRQDSDIADAVDVSPFLEALTARTAEALDGIRKSMLTDRTQSANVNRHMAAAVHQIGTLQKGMAQVLSALNGRLNLVEKQPAARRGVTSLTGAQALHKGMPGEAGGGGGRETLSKAEVVGTLTYMNLEKGLGDIGGRPTGQMAMMLEGGGVLDQQTLDAVNGFLAAHPAEAETARNYR